MSDAPICTSSADGWYFVHENDSNSSDRAIFHRVAVWSTYSDGRTVGMISVLGQGANGAENRLVSPPPLKGIYLHWDELSVEERQVALRQSKPSFMK